MSKSETISAGARSPAPSMYKARSLKPISGDALRKAHAIEKKRLPKTIRLARKSETGSATEPMPTRNKLRNQILSVKAESPAGKLTEPTKSLRGKSIRGKKTAPLAIRHAEPTVTPREEQISDGLMTSDRLLHVPAVATPAFSALEPTQATPGIYSELRSLWRYRQNWHRAEKSLVIQARSICMAFVGARKNSEGAVDKKLLKAAEDAWKLASEFQHPDMRLNAVIAPFVSSAELFETERKGIERDLAKAAKKLPIYAWAKEIYGLGDLGIASVFGEVGDVSRFGTVEKLWKYSGVAVLDGERQRKCSNADKAILHGYSPQRRSVFWNISNGLVGGMGHGPRPLVGESIEENDDYSPYQKLFIKRIRNKCGMTPSADGTIVVPEWRREHVEKEDGLHESYSKHAANDAKRYVLKRFLRDLWIAQSGAIDLLPPNSTVPHEFNGAA